jgi:hypothetical protein
MNFGRTFFPHGVSLNWLTNLHSPAVDSIYLHSLKEIYLLIGRGLIEAQLRRAKEILYTLIETADWIGSGLFEHFKNPVLKRQWSSFETTSRL